eukprot:3573677-Rhodomonas_salina.1
MQVLASVVSQLIGGSPGRGSGVIVDDWIFDTVVKALPEGVTLFAVMDCCHSGSIMDLPFSVRLLPPHTNLANVVADLGSRQLHS